ncbi:MAG: FG-GAP-like repeat-containing protein [Gaiellaceae bacterium]
MAHEVGLDFRHGAFRYEVSPDPVAMTGGGLCWLDYDGDGWLDLYAVNGFSQVDRDDWTALPTSRLFRNEEGRFMDATDGSGAGIAARGQGCVAADLDADGRTDLFVTTAERSVLLWNEGDGRFSEVVLAYGWRTGAAAGDLNGDGRPELFAAGYVDLNNRIPEATLGFPNTHQGVRDLLFVNQGGRRFSESGVDAGLEAARFEYGLGALMSDVDGDADLDLYVANDTKPNRLYENVAWPGGVRADPAGLGFRFEERAGAAGVADAGAGMGLAGGDYDGDLLPDLFVTNARTQVHGVFRRLPGEDAFEDVRGALGPSFTGSTGWGVSWGDLDLDSDLDLVVVNGKIPVTDLEADAELVQAFVNEGGRFRPLPLDFEPQNARGSATADYDNDGDLDVALLSVGGRLALLQNRGSGGNWLEVEGLPPGTVVTAVLASGRQIVRGAQAGSSYLSSEDPRLHFGLGDARRVSELVVRWPGGAETSVADVKANRVVAVDRPEPRNAPVVKATCERAGLRGRSVARVWDEALLDAIRRDVPAPTVHARNLFHLSAAMWDAWAAYDPRADGYFVREKHEAADVRAARETAMSYAVYRILLHRYSLAAGLEETFAELSGTMRSLCLPIGYVSTQGSSPAALGNRIAAAVIARGRDDGSLERLRYVDTSYRPANDPLVVKEPGAKLRAPTRWQPLALDQLVAQNGLPVPGKVQTFVGPHWGGVEAFALPAGADPGPPPADLAREARAVLRYGSALVSRDLIDIGPAAQGGNTLGTNDGAGHARNPFTGKPYAPNRVRRGDYARALTEFWADGPASETPPGHWNTVANAVSDEVASGDRLEWDVKLYFALNGALHDAAVAAWGAKGRYDTVRPISLVRWLADRGELPRRYRTWLPYQLPTFVTPAFAGYVSGHSTFSRAAAEVLTSLTGSPYFPGGLFEWRVPKGSLVVSPGPARDIVLQWATYYDAADQAGISRLYGGIHIPADDFAGRKLGSTCGKAAWQLAQRYFEGTA